jgi:hypothetical protein
MGEIKGFSFYKSYYDCFEDLNKEDRHEMIDAMLDYVFKSKKPKLKGIKKTIWTIIEPNLNTSKNRSNGNSGAPKGNQNACKIRENEEKNETIKKQSKNNQNSINDIKDISLSLSLSYSLSSSLSYSNSSIINNSILNKLFIEYIKLREDNDYVISETVISRLINKLEKANNDEERQEMLEQAINGKWKDLYQNESKKPSKGERRVF